MLPLAYWGAIPGRPCRGGDVGGKGGTHTGSRNEQLPLWAPGAQPRWETAPPSLSQLSPRHSTSPTTSGSQSPCGGRGGALVRVHGSGES